MNKLFIAICLLGAITFADGKIATPSKQDSVQMCPCPEKKGFFSKAKNWIKDNPETAAAIGTAIAGAAVVGYEAYRDCNRYDILIEYKLMHACVQNCSDENSCAKNIVEWECKQKINVEDAEKKLNSCSLE